MRRALPALLAVLLLPLAGCRDVLVDPGAVPQAPAPPSTAPSLYLKGPAILPVSSQGNYRAEYITGVDHYEWRAVGEGAVAISFPYGDTRLPVITGLRAGSVDVIAEAYDPSGLVIGLAAKTLSVR
jgi:hypothetical protein